MGISISGQFRLLQHPLGEFLTSIDLLTSLENNTEFISCQRGGNTFLAAVNPCPVSSELNRSADLEVIS